MIRPGVCLTFDDFYVDSWLAARPILNSYGARVTFCVSKLHTASPAQIDGLHQLQNEGHEIGYHGRTHARLKVHLRNHGLEHWLEHEIDEGVAEHRALGFPATSYASPFHESTRETRAATTDRFAITRAEGPRGVTPENITARIYQKPRSDGSVGNIGAVDYQHPVTGNWKHLNTLLDGLVDQCGVGVFTGHDIRIKKVGPGRYSSHAQLERLLKSVTRRGLHFHTLTGFAQAATRF